MRVKVVVKKIGWVIIITVRIRRLEKLVCGAQPTTTAQNFGLTGIAVLGSVWLPSYML